MSSYSTASQKPHAVCIPFPAQSHVKAMLKLAKLLHHKGFLITFVNTEFNHNRFLRANNGSDSLNGYSDFRFNPIPDGLPPSEADATQDLVFLVQSVSSFMLTPFCTLLSQLSKEAESSPTSSDGTVPVPPVSCIVSDGFMPFTAKAAQCFGIPLLFSFSISACSLMGFGQYRSLIERGLAPLPDESCFTNGYLNKKVDWIPGMKDIRLKDLPTNFRTNDRNDIIFNFCIESADVALKASAILLQTFDALEVDVLVALSHKFSHLYAIGPLQLLLNQICSDEKDQNFIGYSLWKEEVECLRWLDSKESNSVIYVNFGSVIFMTRQQFMEFYWGLADSKCNFIWIIRPDLVIDNEINLPIEFVTETKERGMMSNWCPQEQVLNHPSVGGFMTHCGWNSTIESLSAGVPMLCCPFFADQQTNCKYTCDEWQVGIEIDNNAKRDEVKRRVRELMEGQEGKRLRRKALEWKNSTEDACNPKGSSTSNLDNLVKRLLSLSVKKK